MKKYSFSLSKVCTPAMLYFGISIFLLILLGLNNLGQNELCIGNKKCDLNIDNFVIFILNAIYILFWTLILDLLCKNGWSALSWFIFLLPFILFFVFYSFILFNYT